MENGDISSWASTRIIVVLEGVLAEPRYRGRMRKKMLPVEDWHWHTLAVKSLVDNATRLNIAVEVVTFMGDEVADQAADFMAKYDMPVASVESAKFDWFCQSLQWRPDVSYVVDTEPERIQRYGQHGYIASRGGSF